MNTEAYHKMMAAFSRGRAVRVDTINDLSNQIDEAIEHSRREGIQECIDALGMWPWSMERVLMQHSLSQLLWPKPDDSE